MSDSHFPFQPYNLFIVSSQQIPDKCNAVISASLKVTEWIIMGVYIPLKLHFVLTHGNLKSDILLYQNKRKKKRQYPVFSVTLIKSALLHLLVISQLYLEGKLWDL